ncbi:hypothetical protein ACFFMR_05165 [Micromonospora andamanensis]|uniref:Uncharacterized protein n=1 Tax=Micromonospora andamanensis TaxID=1287068 RepID=A0ABQ4I5V6_9ACTN|nr:hypothetical protein [Micromonospora andamanensis]GIJ13294.1 hypothetical protein Van01_65080 [Micromonospora andamanensis]
MEIIHLVQAGVTWPHLDRAAGATWLAMVYDSARALHGMVTTSVEEPTVGRNHYRVGVRRRDAKPLSILFNAAVFLVATRAELNQPLHERHLHLLTEEERRDVAYHQPSRLGDLLFNWFD